MPPPKQSVSILNALNPVEAAREILMLPKTYIVTLLSMYQKDWNTQLWVVKAASSTSATTEANYLIALQVGGETVSDIKGVNLSVNVRNLNTPEKVFKALGQSAIKQIGDLEELGADLRRDHLIKLTSNAISPNIATPPPGHPTDKFGRRLDRYSVLGPLGFNVSLLDASNNSSLYLVKEDATTQKRVDRAQVERQADGDTRNRKKFYYQSLATNLITLGSHYEDKGSRNLNYQFTMQDSMRVVADEMRLNLDGTSKLINGGPSPTTKSILGKSGESTLMDEIKNSGGIENFLNDEAAMNRALQVDSLLDRTGGQILDTTGNPVNMELFGPNSMLSNRVPGAPRFSVHQEYLKKWMESEYLTTMIASDDLIDQGQLHDFIRKICPTDADFDKLPRGVKRSLRSFVGAGEEAVVSGTQITSGSLKLKKMGFVGPAGRLSAGEELSFQFLTNRMGSNLKLLHTHDFGLPEVAGIKARKGIDGMYGYQERLASRFRNLQHESHVYYQEYYRHSIYPILTEYSKIMHIAENGGTVPLDYARKLQERLDAANEAAKLALGLNAAGEAEDILEAIRDEELMKLLIGYARGPLGKFGINPLRPYMIAKKAINDTYFNRGIIPHLGVGFEVRHEIVDEIPNYAVIQRAYRRLGDSKFAARLPIRNKIWLERADIAASSTGKIKVFGIDIWKRTLVDVTEGKGLFWSDITIPSTGARKFGKGMYGYLDKIDQIEGLTTLTPQYFLTDPLNPTTGLTSIINAYDDLQRGIPIPSAEMEKVLEGLGLISKDAAGNITSNALNAEIFRETLNEFSNNGVNLLTKLDHNGLVPVADRWKFFKEMVASGKMEEFGHYIVGPLNHFTKFANAFRDFFYQEILSGPIGKAVGIDWLINKIGLRAGNNWQLQKAVSNWRVIGWFKTLGTKFTKLGGLWKGPGGTMLKRLLGRALVFIGKLLGFTASGITAGISFILTSFTTAIWKFISNIVRLKPKEAVTEATEEIKKTIYTFARIGGWILGCCLLGCVGPIILIFIVIITMFGGLAPNEPVASPINPMFPTSSTLLSADKTATYTASTNRIAYRITIRNITTGATARPVKIETFEDNLSQTPECDASGFAPTHIYGGLQFVGTADTFPDPSLYEGQEIPVGGSIVINFNLNDVVAPPNNATYTNYVVVTAEGETGKQASASVSTDIGDGGCSTCPQGWPFELGYTYYVTQGPGGADSHARAEAVDFAPQGSGNPVVYATQSGTAFPHDTGCSCDPSDPNDPHYPNCISQCGYGKYVDVVSPRGFRTRYAHLQYITTTGGAINRGDQIGAIGSTGASTGKHLHYEFTPSNEACLSTSATGLPVDQLLFKLNNIPGQGLHYVPETINRNCVGIADCDQILP